MKYILGNWKMNRGTQEAASLARAVAGLAPVSGTEVAVFPPFTAIHSIAEALAGTKVRFGAQDCSPETKDGAFTGEISAEMLQKSGCYYVIVGHSERRVRHGENDELVKKKAEAALKAGLKPVICIGENLQERESGRHLEVITKQAKASLPSLAHSADYLIAYEPVWAIGTGKIATMAEIVEVHKTIASLLYHDTSMASKESLKTPILYGGSVKSANAREIMADDSVDGVLVGGASLDADEFGNIIKGAG